MEILLTVLLTIVVAVLVLLTLLAIVFRAPDNSRYDTPLAEPVIDDDQVSDAHLQVVKKLEVFTANATRDVEVARQQLEDLFYREVDAAIKPVDVNGIPAEWVLAPGADAGCRLLYLHGGAFRVGSPRSHRYLTHQLSARCGLAVLAIDYRMQPEYKNIHCHEDARTAYDWILENGPDGPGAPQALFVAGDSAGGNLTLATIAWARDGKRRAADAAVAFAPLTDMTMTSPTWKSNVDTDPFLGPALKPLLKLPGFLGRALGRIPAGASPTDPMMSPLLGDLAGLPDTLIQVGRDEMLYGDALRYANKATEAGSQVTLQSWPKMVHVFQAFDELPESGDALSRAADFICARLGSEVAEEARVAT